MPMAIARYHADFFALTVESTYTFSMGTHRVYNFNCCTAMASLEGDFIYYFKNGQTNEICRVSADSCQPKTLQISGDGPNPSTIFYYSWITADQMLVLSRLCDSDDMVTVEILNIRHQCWKWLKMFPVKQLRTACISLLNGVLFLANSQEIIGFDLSSGDLWKVFSFSRNSTSASLSSMGVECCFALSPREFGLFAGTKGPSGAQEKLIFDRLWIQDTLTTSLTCKECLPDPTHGYPTNRQCYAAQCLPDKLCLVSGFTRSCDSNNEPLTKHYDIWTFGYAEAQWRRSFTQSPVCSINAMVNMSSIGSVYISGGLVINKSSLASRFSSVVEVRVVVPTLHSLAKRAVLRQKVEPYKPPSISIKLGRA